MTASGNGETAADVLLPRGTVVVAVGADGGTQAVHKRVRRTHHAPTGTGTVLIATTHTRLAGLLLRQVLECAFGAVLAASVGIWIVYI